MTLNRYAKRVDAKGINMKKLEDFDLTSRVGRYRARKAGFDVPKLSAKKPPIDFWSFVDKSGDCWLWTGRVNEDGYGRCYFYGGSKMAHRHAWEVTHGQKIGRGIAMHTCDTPACCNPAHIVIGTHQENQYDKVRKKRHAIGEMQGTAKLSEQKVLEMRSLYAQGGFTYKHLAAQYGVCKDTAQKAVRGKLWKHV